MKLWSRFQTIGQRRPRQIGVRDAWLDPDRYADQRVALVGVVRAFDLERTAPPYFALDDGPQRVGLQADAALLSGLIGREVRAIGTLTFKPGVGIFLQVEQIASV